MKSSTGASLLVSTFLVGGSAIAQTTASTGSLEEVIVTGYRGSLERAAEIKQEAGAIVDAISAEDIGQFPDANIADSLQRVTGVQISRDRGGEARFVSIRGLGSQFNMTTLNGRVLATDNAGRDFSFDVMPSEALQSVSVYKTPMASLTEGSIGGLIEMKLLNPLTKSGFNVSGSLGGLYDESSEETTPRASVVVSDTFKDETVGAFLGLMYIKRDWRADTYESYARGTETTDSNGDGNRQDDVDGRGAFPGIGSYQIKSGERERVSAVAGLKFQPTERFNTAFDFFYSDFKTPENSYSYNYNFYSNDGWGRFQNATLEPWAGNGPDRWMITSFDLTNIPIEIGNDTKARRTETYMAGWNTTWQMNDRLSGTFDIAYSEADRPNHGKEIFTVAGYPSGNFRWSANGPVPQVQCTLADGRNCWDITNDQIGLHFMELKGESTNDTATSARLDFDYKMDAGILSTLEFGAFYSDQEKDKQVDKTPQGCAYCDGFVTTLGSLGINAVVPFPSGGYGESTIGTTNRWPALEPYRLFEAAILARGQAYWDANLAPVPELRSSSNVQETISGAYVQANLAGERWDANVGVRYVNTDDTSSGHTQQLLALEPIPGSQNFRPTFSDVVPVGYDTSYDNWLPSANFTYRFADNLQLRASASQAITRPSFTNLGVDVSWEVNSPPPRLTRNGNPFLEPIESDSYDLSLEWYGSSGSSASAALFYKDITNFVTTAVVTQEIVGYEMDVTQPINGDTATIMGLELAVQQLWESGWGVQANYTYVDNDAKLTIDNEKVDTKLDGVSENTVNLSGFYEHNGISARLSYVYRDDYVDCGVCGPRLTPRTSAESAFLDFSGSYDVTDMFTIYLDVQNLTEESTHTYYMDERFTHYYEQFPRRYEAGVRVKFW